MIGSESPVEEVSRFSHLPMEVRADMDEQPVIICTARPPALSPHEILIIHSSHDRVISHLQLSQLADMWCVPVKVLHTVSTADCADAAWAEDVQHDFIAAELLPVVFQTLLDYFIQLQL